MTTEVGVRNPETETLLPGSSREGVQAQNLTRIYGEQRAVNGINFSVRRGETFGLLGPNGAGKSTTMRMIACRTPNTSGRLRVLGLDVGRDSPRITPLLGR